MTTRCFVATAFDYGTKIYYLAILFLSILHESILFSMYVVGS